MPGKLTVAAYLLVSVTIVGVLLIIIGAAVQNVLMMIIGVVLFVPAVVGDLMLFFRYSSEIRTVRLRVRKHYKFERGMPRGSPSSLVHLTTHRMSEHRDGGGRGGVVLQNVTRHQSEISPDPVVTPGHDDTISRYNSLLHRLPAANGLMAEMENEGSLMQRFAQLEMAVTASYDPDSAVTSPFSQSLDENPPAYLKPLDATQLVTLANLGPDPDMRFSGDATPIGHSTPIRSASQSAAPSPSLTGPQPTQKDNMQSSGKAIPRKTQSETMLSGLKDGKASSRNAAHQGTSVSGTGNVESCRSSISTIGAYRLFDEDRADTGQTLTELHIQEEIIEEASA